ASLTREQKEAVGLLQIGTLLEYFDLMLYVHMAVLLNELFFPKTDPHTASLLTAFLFHLYLKALWSFDIWLYWRSYRAQSYSYYYNLYDGCILSGDGQP